MAIPKQAQDAADKAASLMAKQAEGTPDPTPVADAPAGAPAPDPNTPVTPPGIPDTSDKKDDELDLDALTPPPKKDDAFEARYLVLQGKYDAEVPVLYKQISELKIELADLQSQLVAKKPSPDISGNIPKSLEYLRKEMPEFEEAVNYLAEQRAKQIMSEQMGTVNTRVDNLANSVVANTSASFYSYLDKEIKNWQQINNHPAFAAWLQETDKFIGLPRMALLQDAYQKFDGPRAAAFFAAFITEAKVKTKGVSPADKFAAPDSGGGGAENTPAPGAVVVNRSDIQQFYAAVARGDYKQNPEGMKKREAEINAAIAAGKVA